MADNEKAPERRLAERVDPPEVPQVLLDMLMAGMETHAMAAALATATSRDLLKRVENIRSAIRGKPQAGPVYEMAIVDAKHYESLQHASDIEIAIHTAAMTKAAGDLAQLAAAGVVMPDQIWTASSSPGGVIIGVHLDEETAEKLQAAGLVVKVPVKKDQH